MNRELVSKIAPIIIRHAITVYGGSKLFAGDFGHEIEGTVAILLAMIWSYLDKRSPKVDASKSDPKP